MSTVGCKIPVENKNKSMVEGHYQSCVCVCVRLFVCVCVFICVCHLCVQYAMLVCVCVCVIAYDNSIVSFHVEIWCRMSKSGAASALRKTLQQYSFPKDFAKIMYAFSQHSNQVISCANIRSVCIQNSKLSIDICAKVSKTGAPTVIQLSKDIELVTVYHKWKMQMMSHIQKKNVLQIYL